LKVRIYYLPSAQADLPEAVEYLTAVLDAPKAAADLLNKFDSTVQQIARFPYAHELYRTDRPMQDEIRKVPHRRWFPMHTPAGTPSAGSPFQGVFVGSPRWIMVEKTALHCIGEDAAQTGVQSLNGAFGERFSGALIFHFPHISVKLAEVFRTEVSQFVVPQGREDAGDILFVPCEGGFCQLVGRDF